MDFRRLFDLLPYQAARFSKKIALAHRQGIGWQCYSTAACVAAVNRCSATLLEMGFQQGDRIAIIAREGSPDWLFLDLGMQQIGLVPVSIHVGSGHKQIEAILKEVEVQYCIVHDRETYEMVESIRTNIIGLTHLMTLRRLPDLPSWSSHLIEPTEKHLESLQSHKAAIHEDDLATIIYTSGSSGRPLGVMLSHRNLVSNIKSIIPLIPVNYEKRTISFLPFSHIFERMVVYTYVAVGASLYFAETQDNLEDFFREVKPHYFTVVPRHLEKMHQQIRERVAQASRPKKILTKWAIGLGKQYNENGNMPIWYWLKLMAADWLVYRHWRRRLGGKVEGVVVGAAALPVPLGRMFTAAGIPVREGYGLTETSPVVAFNRFEPGGVQFGTVGIPIPGVEVRIEKNGADMGGGEILVRGPNVMQGYFRQPEASARVFTGNGWLRTGDLGRIVRKRFLQVTGRKKDVFKTSSGKYVAPGPIENALKDSPFIEQCMVFGANRPYVAAMIVPCFPVLREWCLEEGIHWTAPQFMVINTKVRRKIEEEIAAVNEHLESHQKVRGFLLLYQEWTQQTGELTPTLKPRRALLKQRRRKEVEALYQT